MIWNYLVENDRMNSFFAAWYSLPYWWIYVGIVLFCLVVTFVLALIVSSNKSSGNGNERPKIRRVIERLLEDQVKDFKRSRIIWLALIFVACFCYVYFFKQIISSPDLLLTAQESGLQKLPEEELIEVVNFLYRFSIFGVFLIILLIIYSLNLVMFLTTGAKKG